MPAPPDPPSHHRRLSLSRAQRFGLPVLMLIPLLALAGVFGERDTSVQRTRGTLLVAVRSPARLRYRQRMTLALSVSNRGTGPLADVRVRFDSAYLGRFSGVVIVPQASADGSVWLGTLMPSSSAGVSVTLEGERAGRARGGVTAVDARGDTVRLPLATFVFP